MAISSPPLLQSRPLLGNGPHSVEAQHCGSCLQTWGPILAHQLSPHFSRQLLLRNLRALVHARIGPPHLDECQGGCRWGADSLVGSLVDLLTSQSSSHTFVAFIDIHKAFDTSWVEGTLVRLFDAGVSGQMWWFDSGIAQGRVLSPLLFNLLVNGLAATVRRSAPGAQFFPTGVRNADDVVIPADSESDLQTASDAISEWGCKWRFTFSISPTKSGGLLVGVMTRFPVVEQRGTLVSLCRAFCSEAPSGDLFHCLLKCPAISDLRDQWCRQCSIHPDSVFFWARHP